MSRAWTLGGDQRDAVGQRHRPAFRLGCDHSGADGGRRDPRRPFTGTRRDVRGSVRSRRTSLRVPLGPPRRRGHRRHNTRPPRHGRNVRATGRSLRHGQPRPCRHRSRLRDRRRLGPGRDDRRRRRPRSGRGPGHGLWTRRLPRSRRPHDRRQEEQRVEVALRVRCPAHAEVDVGHGQLRRAARADGADHVAFPDRRPVLDRQRLEVQQRHGVPGGRQHRDGLPTRRHGPCEGDDPARGCDHFRARWRSDVDASVKAGRIWVGPEAERP